MNVEAWQTLRYHRPCRVCGRESEPGSEAARRQLCDPHAALRDAAHALRFPEIACSLPIDTDNDRAHTEHMMTTTRLLAVKGVTQ